MKKRILAFLLASAMMVSIAGCKKDEGGTGGGNNTQAPAGGGNDTQAPVTADGKTVINFYTFTEETARDLLPFVYEQNPGFTDKYQVNVILEGTATTYVTKVESALESGTGIDIYVADADYARKFATNPKTASVKDYIDTFSEDNYYPYVLDMMRVGGDVKALSHQATPGVMYYRADLAKDLLGVNNPAEMQAKVDTFEHFLATADELKAKGTYMVYGTDELKRNFLNGRQSSWVEGGKLNIDEELMKKMYTTVKTLYEKDEVAYRGTGQWAPGWTAAMKGQEMVKTGVDAEGNDVWEATGNDLSAFAFFGCTWYLHYTIKPGSIANGSYDELKKTMTDQQIVDSGNGTFGKWGMCDGPAGFFWGGTYWYAPTFLVEDASKADVLEGVATIIKTMCVTPETVKEYAFQFGDFVSNKTVVEEIKDDPAFNNPFLGGQNHYAAFATAAPNVDASKNVSIYDANFDTYVNESFTTFTNALDAGKSFDEAYKITMKEFVDKASGLGINAEDWAGKFD